MDDPSENYDEELIEEAEDPIGDQYIPAIVEDSDDDDNLPEFANDENKKLKELTKEKKKLIKKINKDVSKDLERKKILQEHLKNVEEELLHTKTLIDNKNK